MQHLMTESIRPGTEELPKEAKETFDWEKQLLAAKGFKHYGIFADDPEALKLFDEIEEQRSKHLIEPA